jgi:hypothetical protein
VDISSCDFQFLSFYRLTFFKYVGRISFSFQPFSGNKRPAFPAGLLHRSIEMVSYRPLINNPSTSRTKPARSSQNENGERTRANCPINPSTAKITEIQKVIFLGGFNFIFPPDHPTGIV